MLHLIVLDRAAPTEPVALAAGQRIGRHPRCEVRLDDPSISRLHARVEERAGALWLVDADSRNGLR
ncbi:MAG: FHA domain-containing protein, partial [Planctomycetota bacterium]